METNEIKNLVVETGRLLLEEKLVARTWGNVSARVSDDSFAITPSGLDYLQTTPGDIVIVKMGDELTWEGSRKPSSEKGIHAAAYKAFPQADFVIHTHQDYASAIGVAGFDKLDITEEEKAALGGIALAGYGLPGTKKLKANVTAAFSTGAMTVFMAHHGVVIAGETRDQAMEKAILLEKICRRNMKYQTEQSGECCCSEILEKVKLTHPNALCICTPEAVTIAKKAMVISSQLDDMAQMIGGKLPVVKNDAAAIAAALNKCDAVTVQGAGIFVNSAEKDDAEALALLAAKSAITKLQADALGVKGTLSAFDCILMRTVYKMKYSKKKNG